MSCRHCRDSNESALRAMQRDLDIALRDAERANRTGLELVEANNKLTAEAEGKVEALRIAAQWLTSTQRALFEGGKPNREGALIRGVTMALAVCRAALEPAK